MFTLMGSPTVSGDTRNLLIDQSVYPFVSRSGHACMHEGILGSVSSRLLGQLAGPLQVASGREGVPSARVGCSQGLSTHPCEASKDLFRPDQMSRVECSLSS